MVNTDEDLVVLVDERDWKIGTMPKIQAHQQNKLHRALSVLIFNSKGEMLLHKRAEGKYHSSGLWTNACCSHPRPEEPALEAAKRRLEEEMGFSCALSFVTKFQYNTPKLDNDLYENELLHMFVGYSDKTDFNPNKDEVAAYRWVDLKTLDQEIKSDPESFSYWLRHYWSKFNFQALADKKLSDFSAVA